MRNDGIHNKKRFARVALKCLLFALLFSLVFASVIFAAFSFESSGIDSGAIQANVADAATDVSATATTTYTLGFANFTQLSSDNGHITALKTHDSGKGFQFNCDGHWGLGGCDANVVAYAKVTLGSTLKSSDVAMTFSVENLSNGGDSDKWGIAVTTSVPTVSGIGDSAFSPANAIGKSGWNEAEKVVKNCDAVMASSYSAIYVAVYGNSDKTLEMFFSNISISFFKPEKNLSLLTSSISSLTANNFVFKHTVGSYTGGADRKTARSNETVGVYGSGANDATGVHYMPIKITGTLLNHVKNGATVNIKLSVTNAHNGGDSDKWGIALTSGVPSLTNVSDKTFNPTSLVKSEWNENAGDTKAVTAKIPSTTTTVIYAAIYSNSDSDWDLGWKDIKVTIDSYSYNYDIKFVAGTNGTISTTSASIIGNSANTPKETVATCTATANTGYHFVNWTRGTTSTQQSTSATLSVSSSTFFSYGNTYKANFTSNTGTIVYNANGGTGSIANQSISYAGSPATLNAGTAFTRSDYTLIGWSADRDSFDAEYKLRGTVSTQSGFFSLASETGKSFTLYAIWKQSDFGVLDGKSRTDGTWGSADNPFVLESSQHLMNLSNIVNGGTPFDSVSGEYLTTINTVAKDIKYANCYFLIDKNLTAPNGFVPIGKNSTYYFAGTIYGGSGVYSDAKTTRTVTVNVSAAGYSGLIGYYKDGSIEYIAVTGSVTGSGAYVGGLIGYAAGSYRIEHCENGATVSANGFNNVGGILGYGSGSFTISDCKNTGKIDGNIRVGGIIGYANGTSGTILRCTNTGNVNGLYSASHGSEGAVGGILGRSDQTIIIENCQSSATVSGEANGVGGIVGYNNTPSYGTAIRGCKVSGTVSGGINVGGIAGRLGTSSPTSPLIIENCYNSATVSQTAQDSTGTVGGIVGYFNITGANAGAAITNCVNAGSVNCSDENIGGIAGNINVENSSGAATVTYCYNLGAVSTAPKVASTRGGIIGKIGGTVNIGGSWNFHQGSTNNYGSHVVATSAVNSAYYPSVNTSDVTSTDWSLVANGTVYTAFRLFGSALTVSNGNYLRIYSHIGTTYKTVAPASMSCAETLLDSKSADVRISNAVFSSDILDANNNNSQIARLRLDTAAIKAVASDIITKAYLDLAAKPDDWLTVSANSYITSRKAFYWVSGAWTETAPDIAGEYPVKLSVYNGDNLVGNRAATYKIDRMNIASKTSDGTEFVMPFGYSADGLVSNSYLGNIAGNSYYQLESDKNGRLFSAPADSPFALVYKDGNGIHNSLNNYILFHKYTDPSTLRDAYYSLDYTGDLDILIEGFSVDGDDLLFGDEHLIDVVMTLTGKGNYSGTRTIRFTLMDSDFGGDLASSDWGSEAHPYVIEHDAHLLRLSQIVNGAQAWNSIASSDTSLALINNAGAVAKSRTFAGAYFRLGANVSASTNGGFVSVGTKYGASDTLYRFAGSFNGLGADGALYTISLDIDESGREYVGLFGYVAGDLNGMASLANIHVTGSVTGGNHTGGVVGLLGNNAAAADIANGGCNVTGGDYTGGIFGRVQGASLSGTLSEDSATFANSGTVTGGDYVGGITGYAEKNIGGVYNSGNVSGVDHVGGIVGYAANITLSSAKSSKIVTGVNYVGGIIGYADGVTFEVTVTAASSVNGTEYVGGMAGYIRVTAASQIVSNPVQSAVTSSIVVDGTTYVGGYAGWMDASGCDGFRYAPYLSNNDTNKITVKGADYVGGIFGGFVGKGYKRASSDVSASDSVIYIRNKNADNNSFINMNITLKGGRVAGGLFGYASGVGVVFTDNWVVAEHATFTFGGATNFFGGVAGVLGENATVESAVQLSDGGYEIGGQTVSLRYSTGLLTITNNGDFVGTLFGYIASTAGKYMSSDTTVLGNNVQMLNSRTDESTNGVSVTGKSYIGGLIGAIGRVESYGVSGDTLLSNLLTYGRYDSMVNTVVNSTVRLAPIDDNGNGKLVNRGRVVANGDYAGGIVGYAGLGSLLAFVNKTAQSGVNVNSASSYLSVFNGYSEDITSGSTLSYIQAKNYAGGLVGYVSSAMHNFEHVVSTMIVVAGTSISSATGAYAGGLIGYMGGGRVSGSIAGYGATSTAPDSVRGNSYIGGLVGRLAGGQVVNSIGYGFSFDRVSSLNGGVVGATDAGTSVTSSWTVYVAKSPTYSTKSANLNGKYVIIDKDVLSSRLPNAKEYAIAAGVLSPDVVITTSATIAVNKPTYEKLSLKTFIPTDNRQLVFYNVSGTDTSTDNVFDVFEVSNGDLYYRLDMAASNNFSICVVDIEFKDIQVCKSTSQAEKDANAEKAYRRPASGNTAYTIDATANYDTNGYISSLSAKAYYENGGKTRLVGNYVKNSFTTGEEGTPYIISSLDLWRDLRDDIKAGTSFRGKYVKLAANLSITSVNDLAGSLNGVSNGFDGIFDGDGYTIDINITGSTASALSLFPFAKNATFKNLTISGSLSTSGSNIAAFVGEPQGALTFINCTSKVKINALRSAGGFVGTTNGYKVNFVTCVNTGNITSTDGTNENYENYAYGTGGLVGVLSTSGSLGDVRFESCKNSGKITGGNNVGGIIGLSNGTGENAVLGLEIFNSANTGAVTANNGLASEPNRSHAYSYAGGILGKSGNYGYIRMYSSFNSGTIVAYGSICGGLVGGVGELNIYKVWNGTSRNQVQQGGESRIVYCYNNGEVHVGGTTSNGKLSDPFAGGYTREALNGSIVGGIAGILGWGKILYSYNTGGVHCYQVVGEYRQWQNRMGGILGQAQPSEPDNNVKIIINYCYSIGLCVAEFSQDTQFLLDFSGDAAYGASICGFMDEGDNWDNGHSSSTSSQKSRLQPAGTTYYNYVLKDNLYYNNKSTGNKSYFTGVMDTEGSFAWVNAIKKEEGRYVDGIVVDNVADLTTYHTSTQNGYSVKVPIGTDANQAATLIDGNGNYRANYDERTYKVTYDDDFLSGKMQGYVYIYGCLPQLAMFSMDTKEGLSMLSVSFGRDRYNDWQGAQAGSEESPYIIKDGIGLQAMSTLLRAKSNSATYTFHDKYVAFANGENNIDEMSADYINMDMSTAANAMKSGTSADAYNQFGKNYFLYDNGALGRSPIQHNSSDNLRTVWVGYNNYFNGTSYTTGSDFYNYANFYPIGTGGASSFEGSISGAHYTRDKNGNITSTSNTQIRNLKISQKAGDSFAGLFGSVYDSEIEYITVSGIVKAYGHINSASYYIFAGGIAGYAGGNTSITGCRVGADTANTITVRTFGLDDGAKSGVNVRTFAGGIVGAAGPRKGETLDANGLKNLKISDCYTMYADIAAVKNNSGGIAGYAGDPWGKTKETSNVVEFGNLYVYANTSVSAVSGVTDIGAGTDIGGIVGSNDGIVRFDISKAYVGYTSSLGVTVSGENSVGGIIGTARGNLDISDVTISQYATIVRYNRWGNVDNMTENGVDYGTAIGGIIGRGVTGTNNFLYGHITFEGRINIPTGTTNGETKNIGGIIGAMGTGTQFQSGSNVTVAKVGTISAAVGKGSLFNIGGIAGVTLDGAFDGTFTVNITMTLQNASRVGGLIGYNKGVTHILASTEGTVVNVGADIKGASEVGGLIGQNGEISGSGIVSGSLQIGADMYMNTAYTGSVRINILSGTKVSGDSNADGKSNVGGIVGLNQANVVITKGDIINEGRISGAMDNVGGIVGNNDGYIDMGGSSVQGASLTIQNKGAVDGGDNVGGVIGYLRRGIIAGVFANSGSVAGKNFVGGSIGRVDSEAILTANGADTYFYNGETDSYESRDFEARAAASENGTVNGSGNYVGGSIGALFGSIRGVGGAEVYFINAGTVNGANYVGGNIGMLAGGISQSQLINTGSVTSNGSAAIGGSVGIIGVDEICASVAHTEISVNGVHFEFSGGGLITVSGSGGEGGVGGAIGIIGGAQEGFGNSANNWKDITMYAASDISAPSVQNVGGAIGLIKANDIVIKNMLAFYTTIVGNENVGGIIGSVSGSGIRVSNSFNIEGTVQGNNAGGIIGLAASDTDASTSYWVKGYKNEELMTLNINNIAENLGKYTAVTIGGVVFTEDLTKQYGTPFDYTNDDADKGKTWETYLSEQMGGSPVSKQNGVWSVTNTSWTKYTTGTESTGWYYVYANNRAGLDVTHTVSNDEKYPSILESVAEREAELVYWKRIANAYTEAERANGDDNTVLTSPIVADIDENAKTAVSGGRPQERHIYAAALASTVSGYYLYMDASGIKPGVYKSTDVGDEHFYINAITAGNTEGTISSPSENVAVYYRSVSLGRPLIYNGYNRYAPITDEVNSGVKIQYITINGAGEPNVSEIDRTKGDYIYTVTDIRDSLGAYKNQLCEADTYFLDITIYYYDSFGNLEEIGGINDGKYVISKLPLDVKLSSSNGEFNGSQTTGSLTVTVNGIALLDDTQNRAVQFAFSGEYKDGDGSTKTIRNDDVNMSALINSAKKSWTYAERAEAQALLPLGTSKLYLSNITVTKSKDVMDVNYIRDDRYFEEAKDYCVTLTFKFTERIVDGKLKVQLHTTGRSASYKADDAETTFAVTPKKITVSITGATTGHYNGSAYKTSFAFAGWAPEHDGAATKYVNDFTPYIMFIPRIKKVTGTPIGGESNVWDLETNRTLDLTQGSVTYNTLVWVPNTNSINAEGIKFEGSYQIGFATQSLYDGHPSTADGNYYLEITDNPLEYFSVKENTLTLTWGNNEGTYNAQKHTYIATLTADEAFATADLLANEVATLFPEDYAAFEYEVQADSNKTSKIIFKIGPNAGTYGVNLPHRKQEDSEPSTENCSINNKAGSFIIDKLALTVGLSGNVVELYNGGYHTAEKIVAQSPDVNANPTWVYDSSNGMYTLTMFGGASIANTAADNQVSITLSYNDGVAAVNVGSYVATLKDENVVPVGANNFTVSASGSGSIIINPAVVTFTWGTKTTFTYNRNAQGRALTAALTTAGENLKFASSAYTPSVSGATLRASVTNAIGNKENLRVPVGGIAASVDAGTYEAMVSQTAITVSGTNAAGTAQKSNYTFKFADGQTERGSYTIDPLIISSVNVTGNTASKVYDATTEVPSENVGTAVFGGVGAVAPPTSYSVNALYDSAQVGNRYITYTFTLTGADAKNFRLNNKNSVTYTRQISGTITARQIEITLDMLRNGRATRVYNGTNAYGGSGASNTMGNVKATSAIHRSGEGFIVTGFAEREPSGAVIISAVYAEATSGRTAFDGYVNNVNGTGSNLTVGPEHHGESGYYYKNLLFTMSGASAANYSFTVKVGTVNVGDKTGSGGLNGMVTVKDGSNGGSAGLVIEITANVFKAAYTNTAQSYAKADNSYNTDWIAIGGSVDAIGGDSLTLIVVNNWMYEGNNDRNPKKVYKSYTVIRGSDNSKILSARVDSQDGVHVNYKLSNQPVLTIGYFVDKEEFEIGSLASLMIATYYYSVSKSGSDEFGEIISQAVWHLVATAEEYDSGECNKEIADEDGNVISFTDWNDYFAYLASEDGGGHYIFLNTNEQESGWGYYDVDENSKPQFYDKFKQIANISGIITAQDIAILDGMFRKTAIDGDGNIVEEKSYDWGAGAQYLTNFVKSGEGSVITAMGAIFTGAFGGAYDGNGYTIDKFNIVGVAAASDGYFGMFERLGGDDSVGEVHNVHLRNVNILVSGGVGTVYVGAIAGDSSQAEMHNVSVHGSISVSVAGTAYVGGLLGRTVGEVNGAIVLGNMTVKASAAYAGGAVGTCGGASDVISLMQMNVTSANATAGAIAGSGVTDDGNAFMKNSVWVNKSAVGGGLTYTELMAGSVGGYGSSNKYYYIDGEAESAKGIYDVLADTKLTALDGEEESRTNAHESMRLADIVDIYVLLYSKVKATTMVEGKAVDVYGITEISPLVGNRHGTDKADDAIVIGNSQGVALLRELRFATFTLERDVYMSAGYNVTTASGAFYGSIKSNGYFVYVPKQSNIKMFEIEIAQDGGLTPTAVIKQQ